MHACGHDGDVYKRQMLGFKQAPFFDPKNEEALAAFSGADPEAIKNLAKEGTDKLRDTFDKKPAEFKPQDKPEQSEQPTSVEDVYKRQALEWINDDELVEVTPESIRMRKTILDRAARAKAAKNKK